VALSTLVTVADRTSVAAAIVLSASIPASLAISTSNLWPKSPSSTVERSGVTFSMVPTSSRFWRMIMARRLGLSQLSLSWTEME